MCENCDRHIGHRLRKEDEAAVYGNAEELERRTSELRENGFNANADKLEKEAEEWRARHEE